MQPDTKITLKKAPSYEYIGELETNVIYRQGRVYRLNDLTDKKIKRLLEQDPKYWETHFKLKGTKATSSQSTDKKSDK